MIETLGMLAHFDMAKLGSHNVQAMHLFAEASRRAFADRDAYVGDPAFVDVPLKGLIDPAYLKTRAQTIDADRVAALKVPAGDPPGRHADAGPSSPDEVPGTSDMSVVDAAGNGISFTTTVNAPFGAHLMAGGFILNDQLTDFSFRPEQDGKPAANAVAAGKRPRSSMAPLIVFDHAHHLRLLIGSPGGSKIIDYVALALVAHLDWKLGIHSRRSISAISSTPVCAPSLRPERLLPISPTHSAPWATRSNSPAKPAACMPSPCCRTGCMAAPTGDGKAWRWGSRVVSQLIEYAVEDFDILTSSNGVCAV